MISKNYFPFYQIDFLFTRVALLLSKTTAMKDIGDRIDSVGIKLEL